MKHYEASGGARLICEKFLRAYLVDFNSNDAAACLSEDIVWYGEHGSLSGSNKNEAQQRISRGIDSYRQSHEIRRLDLRERTLSPDVREVEGALVLYDRKGNREQQLPIVAICRKFESDYLICSLHFSLQSSMISEGDVNPEATTRTPMVYHSSEEKTPEANDQTWNTLQSVITSLPCGVGLFLYSEGKLKPVFFSNRLCEIFGMTRKQVFDSISDERPFGTIDHTQAQAFVTKSLNAGQDTQVSNICAAKKQDGTPFWARIHLSTSTIDGALVLYAIIYDVTEEVTLRQKEIWQNERYRVLSEVSNALIFDYEPQKDALNYRLSAQDRTENDTTISKAHLINSPWIHPDDRDAVKAALAASAKKPGNATCDFRCQVMKTGFRWYRASYISLADDCGKVFRVVGRVDDIQREKDREIATLAAVKREALFRRCNTASAFLAQEFDLVTGKQVPFGADVHPAWLPEGMTFKETMEYLGGHTFFPDDRQPAIDALKPPDEKQLKEEKTAVRSFELRVAVPGNAYRWTAAYLASVYDELTRHTYAFLMLIDIHEQKLKALKTRELANTDPMTGLNNRVRFERDVSTWLKANGRNAQGGGFALALLDIDEFANINDILGLEYGNSVIREAAETIKSTLNPQDLLCRYGADDFAILLTNLKDEDALKERMQSLRALLYRRVDDLITVTVSIGCVYRLSTDESFQNLYAKADRALRWAKRHGGNQYAMHTPELDQPLKLKKPEPLPLANGDKRVFIRTFGHFDVFVDDKAVLFNYSKAKELLALLVDRKGGFVSAGDAITYLWTDEPIDASLQARYRKTAMHMKNILEKNGIGNIVETISGKRRIVPAKINCDYFDYLAGNFNPSSLYRGTYLADYSWAEATVAELDSMRDS